MTDLRNVYSKIPAHYETVNRIITLGMDRWWRRSMLKTALQAPSGLWLDMCTGTGETALLLNQRAPRQTRVLASDYSSHMIQQFRLKPNANVIPVSLANAYQMPFATNSLQLITTSFATRNLHQSPEHLIKAFSEFHRILAPGGIYVSIESSRPAAPFIDAVFRRFVAATVEPVGRMISGTRKGYAYLSKTIQTFYYPEELEKLLLTAGFASIKWQRLFPGAVAVHSAVKNQLL